LKNFVGEVGKRQMDIEKIANKFIEAINLHDIDAIGELMSDDHTFVDSGGDVYKGNEQMQRSWAVYFGMFPDYKIEAPEFVVSGDNVILLGRACGTYTTDGTLKPENHWDIPAAWKAVVADEKIKLWQVFADNTPVADIMRKEND
jgi:ketosteroid isomerase-like protein